MKKRIVYISIILLSILSCNKDEKGKALPFRTVIVYMVANNNLDSYAINNINEMERGWNNDNGNLIVYIHRAIGETPSYPVAFQITHDTSQFINSSIVAIYPEQNSCDPHVMNSVLSSLQKDYPAQSYGLILWSHATAWCPAGSNFGNIVIDPSSKQLLKPLTKSFGRDGLNEMDIKDLKNAIPGYFDFILFDACYMGSVEVMYELKDKAAYIIASPTEVLSYGYPYDKIVMHLFEPLSQLNTIAKEFTDYYSSMTGVFQSSSVSVVKTSELRALSSVMNTIMMDTSNLSFVKYDSVQQLESTGSGILFDLEGFLSKADASNSYQQALYSTLSNAIPYKAATPKILEDLTITNYSGLSIFIPDSTINKSFHEYYKTLDWYNDSGYGYYFHKFGF